MPMINLKGHRQRQYLCGFQGSISLQQAATQPFHNQHKNLQIFPFGFHIFPVVSQRGSREALEKSIRDYAIKDIFSALLQTLRKILQIIGTIRANSHLSCQKRLGSTCKGLRAFGSMSEGLNKEKELWGSLKEMAQRRKEWRGEDSINNVSKLEVS